MGKNHNSDTESFSKTIKFIQDHFQTKKHQLHCSGSPGGRSSRQVLVHSLLSVEIFCLWSTSTHFMFSFQNHRTSRKFVVCSLEVGIEAIAIRIISFRRLCGPGSLFKILVVSGNRAPIRQQPCHITKVVEAVRQGFTVSNNHGINYGMRFNLYFFSKAKKSVKFTVNSL